MFHLIKKYSNRKMYDTLQKKFITQKELVKLIINGEEIRIEDSDTHVDITRLEIDKAMKKHDKIMPKRNKKIKKIIKTNNIDDDSAVVGYIPAEMRLLMKSLDYVKEARKILENELPFNIQLHNDLHKFFIESERRLEKVKKKYKL